MLKNESYTIQLDCPPGSVRPENLIEGVINETGLTMDDLKEVGRLFGMWTWEINPDKIETYLKAKALLKERITKLYYEGTIRYGSW